MEIDNLHTSQGLLCIDLIITNQPNLILDRGTPAYLELFCHHEIIYCKINFRILPSPPFERKIGILIELLQPRLRRA